MIQRNFLLIVTLATLSVVMVMARPQIESDVTSSFLGRPLRKSESVDTHFPPLLFADDDSSLPAGDSDAILSVTPTSFCTRNGTLTVSWAGVATPTANDSIVVYSPPTDRPTEFDYLDFIHVSDASSNWASGSGTVNFTIVNMRTDYQFRYYLDALKQVLAVSETVAVCRDLPMQIHLALTGVDTEMRVMWVTGIEPPSPKSLPAVRYGLAPDKLTELAVGTHTAHTYQANDMCGPPANIEHPRWFRHPGWIHTVTLTGLTPGRVTYYYRVGTTDIDSVNSFSDSEVLSFQTPAAISATDMNILVVADMGDGTNSAFCGCSGAAGTASRVINEIQALSGTSTPIDFVFHLGDISYARGVGYSWEWFFNLIFSISSTVAYMVGVGNHEYDHLSGGEHDPSHAPGNGFHPAWGDLDDDSMGECARPFYERFKMPETGESVFWYSFNYGSTAHIIHMSTEHDFLPGSPQYQWLEHDLASVDRRKTPWIVLAGHRPMYTSEDYPDDYRVSIHMQSAFESLLHTYSVDLAAWGHYHAYERTCSVFNQTCSNDGTVHVVVGTAGADLDDVDWMPRVWSLVHCNEFGYGRVKIDSNSQAATTSLRWQFVFNDNGTVFDEFTLTKPLPTLIQSVLIA